MLVLVCFTVVYDQAQARGATPVNTVKAITLQNDSALAPSPGDQNWGRVTSFIFPPTDISLSSNTVPENQPGGTLVGTFTSDDPDTHPETHTYTLVSGDGSDDNASFTIPVDSNELRTPHPSTLRLRVAIRSGCVRPGIRWFIL
jgi:hypothetical protein